MKNKQYSKQKKARQPEVFALWNKKVSKNLRSDLLRLQKFLVNNTLKQLKFGKKNDKDKDTNEVRLEKTITTAAKKRNKRVVEQHEEEVTEEKRSK